MRTANLRRQHDTALALAGEIIEALPALVAQPQREHAVRITLLLAKLTGLLRIHFAQEDRALYPSLMASGRGTVAEVARRFFEEMGQIGPLYAGFAEKWSNADALAAAPGEFQSECLAIFRALADRIARENDVLYPLMDAEFGAESRPRVA